jgi:hypothetical protein
MKRLRPSPALIVAILALAVALSGTAYAVVKSNGDAIIKKKSLSGNRLKANTVKGSKIKESSLDTVPAAQRATTVPTPSLNTFAYGPEWSQNVQESANNRGAGWRKDVSGFVHLQGNLVGDGVAQLVATLPTGARPGSGIVFSVLGTGGPNTVIISANGEITVDPGVTFLSVDGISFYPDQ